MHAQSSNPIVLVSLDQLGGLSQFWLHVITVETTHLQNRKPRVRVSIYVILQLYLYLYRYRDRYSHASEQARALPMMALRIRFF